MKKMPTFCANKLVRVANNFFDFFMPYRKFCDLFFKYIFLELLNFFSNLEKLLLSSFFFKFLIFLEFHPHLPPFSVLGVLQRQIRWFRRHIFGI